MPEKWAVFSAGVIGQMITYYDAVRRATRSITLVCRGVDIVFKKRRLPVKKETIDK